MAISRLISLEEQHWPVVDWLNETAFPSFPLAALHRNNVVKTVRRVVHTGAVNRSQCLVFVVLHSSCRFTEGQN